MFEYGTADGTHNNNKNAVAKLKQNNWHAYGTIAVISATSQNLREILTVGSVNSIV